MAFQALQWLPGEKNVTKGPCFEDAVHSASVNANAAWALASGALNILSPFPVGNKKVLLVPHDLWISNLIFKTHPNVK